MLYSLYSMHSETKIVFGSSLCPSAIDFAYTYTLQPIPMSKGLIAAVHRLCVGAIIAEFNIGGYQYALSRWRAEDSLSQRATT